MFKSFFVRKSYFLVSFLLVSCFSVPKEAKLIKERRENVNNVSYYDTIAKQYMDERKYEKAIEEYKKIIDILIVNREVNKRKIAWYEYDIGFCYLVLKDYDNALLYFKRILGTYNYLAIQILSEARINEISYLKSQ